ncbi:MAG: alkaline phosphatase family protein [Anaerolineae bacterium]|jgi:hypothetical protein
MSLTTEVEQTLHSHHLPNLEEYLPPDTFVMPHYEGYSIANVPATAAALLGVEMSSAAPPLPDHVWSDLSDDVRCVVLILIDAVGYLQLRSLLSGGDSLFHQLAKAGRFLPITSVFPSTTVSALTTFQSGRTPLGHGFLGTKLLLSEQGVLANMLRLTPSAHSRPRELLDWGWEPEQFVTGPSLAEELASCSVQSVAHTYLPHTRGGLAPIFLRGIAEMRGHVGFSDLWINLRNTLIERQGERLFAWAYWGGFDTVAHLYGPDAEACRAELRHVGRALEEDFLAALPAAARQGTLLMVMADHGQTTVSPQRVVSLSDHPALKRMLLLPPAGESRAAYLYVQPGQAKALRAYVAEHLADRFILLEMEQAIGAGLFGSDEVTPALRARLGDFLLLARDDSRLIVGEERTPLQGHHGGLTAEEMLVPLLLVRLEELR